MSTNGTNKKLRIYLSVLYVLFLIQWFWSVRHEYLWAVCEFGLEKSSNITDIWIQLTLVSKFFTIIVLYISIRAVAVGITKLIASKKAKS
jgi:hypothetical protein